MPHYRITLHVEKYIADPYSPELQKLIDIQKTSGINRARSEDKRAKSLQAWLYANNMTVEQYETLKAVAGRPFYMNSREIIIPAHQLHGMLAQACDQAPAAVRLARATQIRTIVEFQDLHTGKTEADGVWERFVVVKSGTGQNLSNQRGLRSNPYIANFDAAGVVYLTNEGQADKFKQLIEWAGREVGVGASRKMNFGRFTLTFWEKV